MKERSIGLEELGQQTFDTVPVGVGDWVEEFEIDVYEFLEEKSEKRETRESDSLPSRCPILPLAFFSASFTVQAQVPP